MKGDIVRYRFGLANENAALPVTVGQEVVMCAVDSETGFSRIFFFLSLRLQIELF